MSLYLTLYLHFIIQTHYEVQFGGLYYEMQVKVRFALTVTTKCLENNIIYIMKCSVPLLRLRRTHSVVSMYFILFV